MGKASTNRHLTHILILSLLADNKAKLSTGTPTNVALSFTIFFSLFKLKSPYALVLSWDEELRLATNNLKDEIGIVGSVSFYEWVF
jgi:hypothetical protein